MNTLLELFVFSAKFIIGFGVLFVFAALLILLIFKLSKSVSHLKLSDFDKDDSKLTLSLVNITEKYKERNEQFSSFVMSAFEDDSELSEKLSKKARQYSPDEDKPSVKERYEKIVKEKNASQTAGEKKMNMLMTAERTPAMNPEIQEMLFAANDKCFREMIERDNGLVTFGQQDERFQKMQRWLERNHISYVNLGSRMLYNTWVQALEVKLPLPAAA